MRTLVPILLLTACAGGASTPDEPMAYGPDNGWFHADAADVPADLVGTGTGVGDTLDNFTFIDQHGDEVEMYQFYGKVVLFDVFAEWCGPCQANAPEGEVIQQHFGDDVVVLAAMQEVASGAAPTGAEDAARWADAYGLTHPVVADSAQQGMPMLQGGYPTYPVIGPDMTVILPDLWPPSVGFLEQVMADNGL